MATQEKKIVVAFDAYGTLLSTESIAEKLAEHFGHDKAQTIAAAWRKYQLEYTWRLNSMSTWSHTYSTHRHNLRIASMHFVVIPQPTDTTALPQAATSPSPPSPPTPSTMPSPRQVNLSAPPQSPR